MKRFMFLIVALVALCGLASAQSDISTAMIDLTTASGGVTVTGVASGGAGTPLLVGYSYHFYPVWDVAGGPIAAYLVDPPDATGLSIPADVVSWSIAPVAGSTFVTCDFVLPGFFSDGAGAILPITYGALDAMASDNTSALYYANWDPHGTSPVLPVLTAAATEVYLGFTVDIPVYASTVNLYTATFYLTATVTGGM